MTSKARMREQYHGVTAGTTQVPRELLLLRLGF